MKSLRIPLGVLVALLFGSSFAGAQSYDTEHRRDVPTYPDSSYTTHDASGREIRTTDTPPRALSTTDVAAVEQRRNQVLNRDMMGHKLGAADYQELRRQRHDVDALIARMRAGHPVSSESVDRALGLYDQDRPGY